MDEARDINYICRYYALEVFNTISGSILLDESGYLYTATHGAPQIPTIFLDTLALMLKVQYERIYRTMG